MNNYTEIIKNNLSTIFERPHPDLAQHLGAELDHNGYKFQAFGQPCLVKRDGILLGGKPQEGPAGVLISLYVLRAKKEDTKLQPFVAFKDLPNTMPYQAAFTANAERILIPHVSRIVQNRKFVIDRFNGHDAPEDLQGDESFVLYPLPKIALAYIFYLADEEFPASVTCLFSSNALSFMPLDGLADVAEYTSKAIIESLQTKP